MQQDAPYQIVWLVRRLFRAMAQKSNESLQDLGVSAADRAVMEFLYPSDRLSVPEIARRYQVSRQHVQVTVNRLQTDGFLTAQPNPHHKRSPLVALTSKGRGLFRKIKRRDKTVVSELFSRIPDKDTRATLRTLETLLSQLKSGDE